MNAVCIGWPFSGPVRTWTTKRPPEAPAFSIFLRGVGRVKSLRHGTRVDADVYPTARDGGRMGDMGQLIYSGIASLDGYVADRDGNFSWSEPEEEVHTFVNDLERDVGTYLFGRRMYQVMSAWETFDTPDQPDYIRDFARIWQGADKVVYSTTLTGASTAKTRIERTFDPGSVRELKDTADTNISIGGPTLAAAALQAGLVDECQLFLNPVAVGGGLRFLPDGQNLKLELLEEHRFGNGVVYLRYRTRA